MALPVGEAYFGPLAHKASCFLFKCFGVVSGPHFGRSSILSSLSQALKNCSVCPRCRDRRCAVVVILRRTPRGVPKGGAGAFDCFRVCDAHACREDAPKQMRIERGAERAFCQVSDGDVDRVLGHRGPRTTEPNLVGAGIMSEVRSHV